MPNGAQGTCQCTVAKSTHVGNRRTTKVSYNMKMFLLFNFVTFRKKISCDFSRFSLTCLRFRYFPRLSRVIGNPDQLSDHDLRIN